MKKIYLLFLFFPLLATAQAPAGYYTTALGLNGQQLETALHDIISNGYTTLTYTPGLWNAYYTTDTKANGKLWDIYSDVPGGTAAYEYTLGTNQCGNGANHENSCYNREHTWPQSKFGSNYPMYSDLWIAYPTDYYVNGQRGDLPYGKVGTATKTFTNGTKIGNNTYTGAPSGNCFEPIDSFKGDIARTYFYIVTRYLADSNSFISWEMADRVTLKPWAIQMLLEWHHLDPVSTKEINRNNAAAALQHNRNPFIDYPQFADCIWAGGNCSSLSVAGVAGLKKNIMSYPVPAHDHVTVDWSMLSPGEVLAIDVLNLQGQTIYHKDASRSDNQLNIATQDWAQGIYLLQVKTKDGIQAQKLVIE